jgi:hypothetical protein
MYSVKKSTTSTHQSPAQNSAVDSITGEGMAGKSSIQRLTC